MAEMSCRCGKVRGDVADARPGTVNRVVCYCDDCQAAAHHLGRAGLLDAQGGSDVVQVAPAALRFRQGQDQIRCLRLSPKGVHRWFAACCNTPVGNTAGPNLPFVGLPRQVFETAGQDPDRLLGPPVGAIKGEFAIGEPPSGSKGVRTGLLLATVAKVLGWKLTGKSWPHPFFDRETKAPLYPVTILSRAEREKLRPLCGPSPARH